MNTEAIKSGSIWCEPFIQACRGDRNDARVRPDEIPAALAYFRARGLEPKYLYLNSSMKPVLERAVPEGIEIIVANGVASWEIWANEEKRKIQTISPAITKTPTAPLDSPLNQQDTIENPTQEHHTNPVIVTITDSPIKVPYHRRAQITIYDPIINEAIADGGSLRAIAGRLKEQGIIISHMTISRRKKEFQQK